MLLVSSAFYRTCKTLHYSTRKPGNGWNFADVRWVGRTGEILVWMERGGVKESKRNLHASCQHESVWRNR